MHEGNCIVVQEVLQISEDMAAYACMHVHTSAVNPGKVIIAARIIVIFTSSLPQMISNITDVKVRGNLAFECFTYLL